MSADNTKITFLCILGTLFVSSTDGNQVDQSPFITVREKESAQIKCNYSITNPNALYWYQQIHGGSIVMVISAVTTDSSKGRYGMLINRNQSTTELSIDSVEIEDSSTYYCAVHHTVI
ncbi:T-cell receptor alpha chain V domain [Pelobates cultripes]|nr:T-cell receptor alpha chain V domain [Pelobates cultripes]